MMHTRVSCLSPNTVDKFLKKNINAPCCRSFKSLVSVFRVGSDNKFINKYEKRNAKYHEIMTGIKCALYDVVQSCPCPSSFLACIHFVMYISLILRILMHMLKRDMFDFYIYLVSIFFRINLLIYSNYVFSRGCFRKA